MNKYHRIDYALFGKRMAKRRTELHLSQKALAERLDCNESYISRMEHGKATPSLDFVFAMAQELAVGVDYFLPTTSYGTSILQAELAEKFGQCSPEVLLFVEHMLEEARRLEAATLDAKDR